MDLMRDAIVKDLMLDAVVKDDFMRDAVVKNDEMRENKRVRPKVIFQGVDTVKLKMQKTAIFAPLKIITILYSVT